MFQSYIGDIKKNIILEITKPSTEILTSNRDGFQWTYCEIVQKLVEEITIDKQSFGRLHNTITRITGNSRSFINRVLRQLIQTQILTDTNEKAQGITPSPARIQLKEVLEKMEKDVEAGVVEPTAAITTLREYAKDIENGWAINKKLDDYINDVDFYIQVNDKGYEKIPADICPSMKMKMKYRKMACLWKAALKHVFNANGMDANFCIGWVIDADAYAQYSRKDGVEMFLLNPFLIYSKIDKKNKKEMVSHILMTAAHEVAHRLQTYHDEAFVCVYEKMLLKAFSSLSSYRTLLIAAETETL